MEGGDPETMLAYSCFISFGLLPSQFANLPYREKVLIKEFFKRHKQERDKLDARMKR